MILATAPVLLLTVAMGVALIARRLRVPYTVALVLGGLVLGATHLMPAPRLTRELLYSAFLPGLLFEAAFHLDAGDFLEEQERHPDAGSPGRGARHRGDSSAPLLSPGTSEWTSALAWPAALVFAALIAATDPIA